MRNEKWLILICFQFAVSFFRWRRGEESDDEELRIVLFLLIGPRKKSVFNF